MQSIVSGRLAGMEPYKVTIQLQNGECKVYRRGDLKKDLQWVFDNMGQPVICLLEDGVVTDISRLGEKG